MYLHRLEVYTQGKQQSKLPPPRKWQILIIGDGEGKHKLIVPS